MEIDLDEVPDESVVVALRVAARELPTVLPNAPLMADVARVAADRIEALRTERDCYRLEAKRAKEELAQWKTEATYL